MPAASIPARGPAPPARLASNEENREMAANVGGIDRTLRIVVGIVLIALYFVLQGPVRYVGLLGLVALFTGLVSFCPLYSLLGINTCPMKKV
jgi:predicted cobalt transporter CbtA